MITGYNTDIEFNGVVYHVQTEDKGPAVPMILSLVYDRGTILASKRAPYDLDHKDFDVEVLAERLQRQHKLICAAVMAGRIDDLKRMSAEVREQKRSGTSPDPEPATESNVPVPEKPEKKSRGKQKKPTVEPPIIEPVAPVEHPSPIPMPAGMDMPAFATLEATDLTILDDVKVLEEYSLLDPEDLQIVSDLAGTSRPEHNNLSVEFVGSPLFKGGKTTPVFILVCRGSRREVMRGSEIMVKILGSGFRPVIYHAVTDKNGLATVPVEVPSFNAGRAIVLARAKNEGDEVEVRQPVLHS